MPVSSNKSFSSLYLVSLFVILWQMTRPDTLELLELGPVLELHL
jgi:hypothetical protein